MIKFFPKIRGRINYGVSEKSAAEWAGQFRSSGPRRFKLNNVFSRSRADQGAMTVWYPAVDILESGDAYLIRVELPGLKQEDIHLEFREGMITLSGERKEVPADGVQYVRAERTVGTFSRKFFLPSTIKQEDIQAAYGTAYSKYMSRKPMRPSRSRSLSE
jgi:HSP20 family molecular chaperone IbpA